MSEVNIDRIEIKIGNKTVSLSLAQLKELKAVLDELFPKPIVVDRSYPIYIRERTWFPPPPLWANDTPSPWKHTVYCNGQNSGTLSLSCKN